MKPEKRSVSVVIRDPDHPQRILVVLRPADDDDLPSTWGLPAATLRRNEEWTDAAVRAAREKLGVRVRIDGVVGDGELERSDYILRMREFEATIIRGTPDVDQPAEGVTRYREWEWAPADRLEPAARAGSLCSRIFLRASGREY